MAPLNSGCRLFMCLRLGVQKNVHKYGKMAVYRSPALIIYYSIMKLWIISSRTLPKHYYAELLTTST